MDGQPLPGPPRWGRDVDGRLLQRRRRLTRDEVFAVIAATATVLAIVLVILMAYVMADP